MLLFGIIIGGGVIFLLYFLGQLIREGSRKQGAMHLFHIRPAQPPPNKTLIVIATTSRGQARAKNQRAAS